MLFGGTVEQGLYRKIEIASVCEVVIRILGRECFNNITFLGISCSRKGKLHIWDRHESEMSNNSRQFLLKMLRNSVNVATEHIFHNALLDTPDVVIILLDNITTKIIHAVADFDVCVLFPPYANALSRFDIIESSLAAARRNGYCLSGGLPLVDKHWAS